MEALFSSSLSDGITALIQEIKERKIHVCSNNSFVCDLKQELFAYYAGRSPIHAPESNSIFQSHPGRYRNAVQLRFTFPSGTNVNQDTLYQKLKHYFEAQPMADVIHWISNNQECLLLIYVIEDEYTAFRELSVGNVVTSDTGGLPIVH